MKTTTAWRRFRIRQTVGMSSIAFFSVLVHNKCVPENMSPEGAGRRGAFRAAKQEIGVPKSQQPLRILKNINKRGKVVPGRVYDFGGDKFIRDDIIGHVYKDGGKVIRHF